MADHPFVSHFLKFWVKIFFSYKYKHKKIDYKCCMNPEDEIQDFIEIQLCPGFYHMFAFLGPTW